MQIKVNGEIRQVSSATNVAELLAELEVTARPVAIELNRRVVPLALYDQTALHDGDELEVVTLVGGG